MNKTYVIVLQNQYLLFMENKPKKKGNYLQGVRLFTVDSKLNCGEVATWVINKYESPAFQEVVDWE